MKDYLISVVIPVYNTEKYIRKCVDSVVNQSYRNIEVILVNDGSTDSSGAICDEYAHSDNRIRVIYKKNGGLVSAWKTGVIESTGEYINFLDSDDWVDTNMFEEMSEYLTGDSREIISSDYLIEKDSGETMPVWQRLEPGIYDRDSIEKVIIPKLLGNENRYVSFSRCMKLISRQLILDNMHYADNRISMGEDGTVMLPCLIDCNRIVIMDHKTYYHYLYVSESMVHKYDNAFYDKIKLLYDAFRNIVCSKFSGDELTERLEQLDKEYIFLLMLVVKNEARGNRQNCYEVIRKIFLSPDIRAIVESHKIQISDKSNMLIYQVMRHPNLFWISALKLAMKIYYRK